MVATHKRTMTASEARSFDRYSVANASYVKASLDCGCEPYQDIFTYNRWKALGYQVERGQKAIKIPVVKSIEVDNPETGEPETRKLLGRGAVFCRHQVQPASSTQPETRPTAAPKPAPTPKPAVNFTDKVMNTWRDI
mgnify:CR=1 FL=1